MPVHLTAAIGVVLLLVTPTDATKAETIGLVSDGRPEAVIVLPEEPNPGERRAAEELQAYVEKASGARLPIRSAAETVAGARIVLGRACQGLEHPPEGDGFTIETHGSAVQITGGNARGTLYGAYDFLEDELGVRWFMPGEIGEVVPRSRSIAVGPIERRQQPSFEYRWIGPGDAWSARNRNNVGLPEIGVDVFRSAHTFRVFLDPEKYFDDHPEWFALVGGVRRRNERLTHGNQICTSNPGEVREVIRNMRSFLDENPDVDVITLFPNDGNWFCECDRCKALDEPGWASVEEVNRHGRTTGLRGYGTLSRRMMIFNNTVARALAESHPHVLLKVGAYSCYTNPPHDTALHYADNVIVQICHGWCHNHAITDPECPINADFKRAIEGWSRIAPGGVMLYEYYYKVAQCELPFPILHAMRDDLPYFRRIGVEGVYTQYTRNWGTLTLPYYVAARLLWDVDADVDALLDDFYLKFYGPAAEPMKRYYERLEQAAIESELHFSPPYFRFPELFTDECLADCRRFLHKAKELADEGKVRGRVAMAETSLRYTSLVIDYVKAVRAVDEKIDTVRWRLELDQEDLFAEARAKAEEVRRFMARPEAKNVIRAGTTYVNRLLNPEYTFTHRWDRTDTRQLDHREQFALTKPEWLAGDETRKAAALPDRFDLWIYGHDFDASGEQAEHELWLVTENGKRKSLGPLPPKGQVCNRRTGCLVYPAVPWPDGRRDRLTLEIVNLPGGWTGSTLLAVYAMPSGSGVSPKQAAEIIRNDPERPRREAFGFVELGFRGLPCSESEPARVEFEFPGSLR